jgi:hypothetical protein
VSALKCFENFQTNNEVVQHKKDLPRSRNLVKDRITKMYKYPQAMKMYINSCSYFFVCLNESIDVKCSALYALLSGL